MKISVIIPVKNRADLIGATLQSLFAQSLQPYEVIVIDDHSTDNLVGALNKFGDRVTLLRSEGNGPGAARNQGLRHATGDAIQFLDSDDLVSNNKFAVQAKLMYEKNADFVYGPFVKASEENRQWQQRDVIMQYYPLPKRSLKNLVLEGWCLTQTILFRTSFLKQVGEWREDLITHEDLEYGFRIAKKATNYVHENQTCVIYRQHPQQLTDKAVQDYKRVLNLDKCLQIVKSNIDFTPSLHSLLMFYGTEASNKQFLNKANGNKQKQLTVKDYAGWFYRRLVTKIEVSKNKTGWNRLHGAYDSKEQFANYMKLFESK
jgi:glycosyltransferase involved in cell wall biosynthesis